MPAVPPPDGTRFACIVIVTLSCFTSAGEPTVTSEMSSIDAVISAVAPRFSARRVADESGIVSPLTLRLRSSPMTSFGSMTSNVSPLRAAESLVARFGSLMRHSAPM